MKKHLMVLLLLSSQASLAAKIKYNYEVKSSLNENINGFVVDDKVGRDVEELNLTAGLKKKFKLPKKFKLTFQTKLDVKLHNIGDSFDKVSLQNQDNVNTTLRKALINPKLSFSKKLSKNFILNGGAGIELGRGYSIAQDFITVPTSGVDGVGIGYFVIDDPYAKYSFNLGAALRINKKLTLRGIYKFTDYNHEKNYTFLEVQGSNDRRINSLGLLASIKPIKIFNINLSAQVDEIVYRDRLALDTVGVFRDSGTVEASSLRDVKLGAKLKFFKFISLNLERKDREDLVSNGDGSIANQGELQLSKSLKKLFDFSLGYTLKITDFKSQTEDFIPTSTKRRDEAHTIKGSISKKLTFLGKKAPKLKLYAENTRIISNNAFGKYDNRIAGLALNGNF